MSSTISSSSEAFASELLENLEDMFPGIKICSNLQPQNIKQIQIYHIVVCYPSRKVHSSVHLSFNSLVFCAPFIMSLFNKVLLVWSVLRNQYLPYIIDHRSHSSISILTDQSRYSTNGFVLTQTEAILKRHENSISYEMSC